MDKIDKRETIFTKVIKGEIPTYKLYEDEKNMALLNIVPQERGHTLVIPKKPYETIMEMPENEYLELQKLVHKVSIHLQTILKCDIAIAQKNGKIAEQDIPHVHFHIIPRKDKSRKFFNENKPDKILGNELEKYAKKLKL